MSRDRSMFVAAFACGLFLFTLSARCGAAEGNASGSAAANWVRVAEQTSWTPRDSCVECVFRDRMWLLGGWVDSFHEPPRDVWSSADGVNWQRSSEQAPWKHSDFAMSTVYRDRMWIMGGWHNGRLPDASASNQVWSSSDGAQWQQVTDRAAWSARMAAGCVVFQNKMWILGGTEQYYFGSDASLRNDVWCSEDGKEWKLVTAQAPWAARAYHAAVAFDGKLWVYGGGNYLPNYAALNDVWCSADGVTWTEVTKHAAWSPRIWFSAAVYRDRMWVLGGWSNNPSENWNDVWYSKDGRTWTALPTRDVWKKRHEHSVFVFQDRLWLTAGHAQPLSNEVWRLDLPSDWHPAD